VIYFDVDGTLVDYEADACHAFGKAGEHAEQCHPQIAGRLTDDVFRRARDATYVQHGDTGLPQMEWYTHCMRAALESVDVFDNELAKRMGETYKEFRNTTLEEFEDVLEVVPRLADSFELGLLSNGTSTLDGLKIDGFFKYSVYARDVGCEKPAPEIFEVAAETAGCGMHEIIVVGDGQHTDILGACNAGVTVVWINRIRAELLQGIPTPDHEIQDLRDLIEIATL
jgi:putative hydrolase of the HAD superfamily